MWILCLHFLIHTVHSVYGKRNKWLVYQLIDFGSIREIFEEKLYFKSNEKNELFHLFHSAAIHIFGDKNYFNFPCTLTTPLQSPL